MGRLKVLIAEPKGFSPRAVALLKSKAEVELRDVAPGALGEALRNYDAVFIRLAHRITAEMVAESTRCKVIACPVTGLDHIDLAACERAGIRVVALKGEVEFLKRVRATAELTVGLALALLRQIPSAAESVRAGEWERDRFQGRELFEKTAGVIGLGRLGSIVAGYFQAFGMKVVGYDPNAAMPAGVERRGSLEQLLHEADLVSVHVSFDASTTGLIGARALAVMKPGSWLVNTSRGGVIDEAALLAALASGHLAGAALDVLTGEPEIDLQHPVVRYAAAHRNCLVVPHIGGNTVESFEKTELFIAQRMLEALS